MNIQISAANVNDAFGIQQISYITWPTTYGNIVSADQINFMLHKFYNPLLLTQQFENPAHYFFKVEVDNKIVGYAHCYPYEKFENTYYVSKLYILFEFHGMQLGKLLLNFIENALKAKNITALYLNVNRGNTAVDFYKKMKFEIVESVDIPLDKFWLNDYVMKKQL